jgi:hypothetical protein
VNSQDEVRGENHWAQPASRALRVRPPPPGINNDADTRNVKLQWCRRAATQRSSLADDIGFTQRTGNEYLKA